MRETRPRGLARRRVTPGRGQGCEGQAAPSWQEVSALCSLPDHPPHSISPGQTARRGGHHPRGSGPPPKNWGLGRIRQVKWLEEPWLPSQRERGSSEEAGGAGAFSLQDPAPKGRGHPRVSERKGPFSAHRIRAWMCACRRGRELSVGVLTCAQPVACVYVCVYTPCLTIYLGV